MSILSVECASAEWIGRYKKAGADEVIFALKDMSFTSIQPYTQNELAEYIQMGHEQGIRIAILMNRLLAESEVKQAEQSLHFLIQAGADAVFFADPALMKTAQKEEYADKMVYRPETLLTNSLDAQWWMQNGLQSVEISPLLTKEEILDIAENVKHTSLPIHGHLLMSVSKRKLLSAYAEKMDLQKLAGNRNLVLVEEKRQGRMPIYEDVSGTMIFTDFVQESFQCLKEFEKAGIERFEIEADFLTLENIEETTNLYRQILNGHMPDLTQYKNKYNLPFSEGYLGEKTIK